MPRVAATQSLRRVLLLDAVTSGVTGLLFIVAGGVLDDLLGLPLRLLVTVGVLFLPFAAWVGWVARRAELSVRAVRAVAVVNALWAIDSVLFAVSGWLNPTALGVAVILGQAVVVAVLAAMQWTGLRRSGMTPAIA